MGKEGKCSYYHVRGNGEADAVDGPAIGGIVNASGAYDDDVALAVQQRAAAVSGVLSGVMLEFGNAYCADDAFGDHHLFSGLVRDRVTCGDGSIELSHFAGIPEGQGRGKRYFVHVDAGQVDLIGFVPYAVGYYDSFYIYVVEEPDSYGTTLPNLVLAVGGDVGIGDHVSSGGGYEAGAKSLRGFDLHYAVLYLADDFRQGGLFSSHGILRWVWSGWLGGHYITCPVG